MARYLVAVDVGGTFTDLVALDAATGALRLAKVPSTPPDFFAGVVRAIEAITADFGEVELFIHGTTAHLNALLERKGARCALLTTRGFGDVLEMRRGARPEAYDLHFRYPDSLIPRRDIFEVNERIDAQGRIRTALDESELDRLAAVLRAGGYQSAALCFLHSYRNPVHEQQAAAHLRGCVPDLFITPSVEVCREWREYERTSTVALNAYVSPILGRYLRRLRGALEERGFRHQVLLMQSHGGLMGAAQAESRGVLTLMSGPVGGNVGCRVLSRQLQEPNLICVDMGGTSFDISLIAGGEPAVTSEKVLAGNPVLAPMVDIHTIGAGGGSIAWTDMGALRVGPQSAGASPGPACYDRGGTAPTVTDANVVLGRLDLSRRYGGNITLRPELAAAAVGRLGEELNLSAVQMAQGILDVVNAQMANAIRTMTVRRGIDPRDFALVAFGGAGPMHAVFLAEELGIRRIIIPGAAGAFSAWGMLETEIRHDLAQTHIVPLLGADQASLRQQFAALERELRVQLDADGVNADQVQYQRSFDLRYVGQEHYINVPLPESDRLDLPEVRKSFDEAYRRMFAHSNLAEEAEIVNLRVQARGPLRQRKAQQAHAHARPHTPLRAEQALEPPAANAAVASDRVRDVIFAGHAVPTRFIQRDSMKPDVPVDGPLIIDEPSCTSVVPPDYRATLLDSGHVIIQPAESLS